MHRIESVLRRMFPAARPYTRRRETTLPPSTRPVPKSLVALESAYRCEPTSWGADQPPLLSLPLPRMEPPKAERRQEPIRSFRLGDLED